MTRGTYINDNSAHTETVFDGLYQETQGGMTLDSTGSGAVKSFLTNGDVPASLQAALEIADGQHGVTGEMIVDSVLKGMRVHQRLHGVLPTADVLETALDQVKAHMADGKGLVLDGVGGTAHHDPLSTQPERIQIGILSQIAEAFPAATYLPVGIGSNQALLGIVAHQAASANGEYASGDTLDGVNIGKSFLSSERTAVLTLAADRTSAAGALVLNTAGGQIPLLRNRTIIYVNGFPVAEENGNYQQQTVVNSAISGLAILKGVEYTISGQVKPATGEVTLAFNPALPDGTKVVAEGYLDYEAQPNLAPEIQTRVQTYSLFAKPWRGVMRQTIDSKSQYEQELGLNLLNESLMTARNQITVERHRSILRKAVDLASSNVQTFNFDYTGQMEQKVRAQIWQDFSAVLGLVDQQMAEDTMDRGTTHLYVTKMVKAQWESLPSDLFEKSGITSQPGIYRVGKLFGRYEVYYTPWELKEDQAAGTAQILCLGRSMTPARNTFVMGDAVPVITLPTSFGTDMRYGQVVYTRNFTSVNPHRPSARGCGLINVINLFKAA